MKKIDTNLLRCRLCGCRFHWSSRLGTYRGPRGSSACWARPSPRTAAPGSYKVRTPGLVSVSPGWWWTASLRRVTCQVKFSHSFYLTFLSRSKELVHDSPDSRVVYSCVHCSIVESSGPVIELPAALYHCGQQPVRLVWNNRMSRLSGIPFYLPGWWTCPGKNQHGWTSWSWGSWTRWHRPRPGLACHGVWSPWQFSPVLGIIMHTELKEDWSSPWLTNPCVWIIPNPSSERAHGVWTISILNNYFRNIQFSCRTYLALEMAGYSSR